MDEYPVVAKQMKEIAEEKMKKNEQAKNELKEILEFMREAEKQQKDFALQNLAGRNKQKAKFVTLTAIKRYKANYF